MRVLGAAVLLLLVMLLGAAAALYLFLRNHAFSARDKPAGFEAFLARRARRLAIPPDAAKLKNPLSATPLNVAEGRDHFADHCAICHANNGNGETMISAGLYPPVPDMRKPDTQNLTDGEIFYIIKNGIRFTGMPGWDGEDEDNWKLVLFVRHLPQLTPQELELMKEVNTPPQQSESKTSQPKRVADH